MKTNLKFFLLSSLLLLALKLNAQSIDEYNELNQKATGYVILRNGDTLRGQIKVQTRLKSQFKVLFYASDTKRRKTYRPRHLSGYGYEVKIVCTTPCDYTYWRHFHTKYRYKRPHLFASKYAFWEVKETGRANLYSCYTLNERLEYNHTYLLEIQDGTRERLITKGNFDWAVLASLEDCPEISDILEQGVDYSKMAEIVKTYNQCDIKIEHCDHMQYEEPDQH